MVNMQPQNQVLHLIKLKQVKLDYQMQKYYCCDAIEHYNVDPMIYLKTPQQQKRHVFKKSLFSSSQDDPSMSASVDPVKELSEEDFTEEQIHLIPKLPGQTTDKIKIPIKRGI